MKYYTPLLLAASLSFGALTPVNAQPKKAPVAVQPKKAPAAADSPEDVLYKSILESKKSKKYSEMVEQAEQGLKIEGLSDKSKVRFLLAAAEASSKLSQHEQAATFYERIVADPATPNNRKIAALENISDTYIDTLAGQFLDQMNLAPAHDILDRALKLPGLTPEEQAVALKNIGDLDEREDKFDQAIATYQKIVALDVSDKTKTATQQLIADAYASSGQTDKAVAIYQKNGFDLVKLYNQLGETELAVATATKILDDAAATEKDRWDAFKDLPYWSNTYDQVELQNNIAGVRRMSEKYLPAFLKVDPNHALQLLGLIKSDKYTPVFRNSYYDRNLANPDFVVWAAPLLLQAPKLSDKDYLFVKRKYINALMAQGDVKQATKEMESMAKDERADAATRFWAQLTLAGLTGKPANIDKLIKEEKTLSAKETAEEVLNAGQTALVSGNNQAGRDLYAAYEGLFNHLPTATIDCPFTNNAPFDTGSWLTSPLLKNAKSTVKLDRPYGDNLKALLETDSSTTGRNTADTSAKSTGDSETNFHIACDAQGIHLFFDAHDARAQEVFDGLLRGGSFEMYIAPGKDQAYLTFLPRFPLGQISTGPDSFSTMYPNAGYRPPSTKDGTLRSQAHLTKDGFGLSMFLSWQLFYDKLPKNGTEWPFESIRWTRSGGLSFAGSQSVHNRSSWGNIIFNGLTPENLNAIKRGIVLSAKKKYHDAKQIAEPVSRWNDPELGDPAFYQSQVAPLLDRLDKYEPMVKNDMTAADVETVFNEAVPGWMEIEFTVAALRRQYLEEKFLK